MRDLLHVPGPIPLSDPGSQAALTELADYLAPELAQPNTPPDQLTDIYGLGCLMYQMLSGQSPLQEVILSPNCGDMPPKQFSRWSSMVFRRNLHKS